MSQTQNVVVQSENFTVEKITTENDDGNEVVEDVRIKGLALPFGEVSRNGVQYEKESVKETADQLEGKTMLFNHNMDKPVGHVVSTEVTDDGLFYEGSLNPNAETGSGVKVAEAVERGDISSVSIQVAGEEIEGETAEPVIEDQDAVLFAVRDWYELSPVTIAGFPQTSAMPEHLQEQGVVPIAEAFHDSTHTEDDDTMAEEDESDAELSEAVEERFNTLEQTLENLAERVTKLEADDNDDEDDDEEDDEEESVQEHEALQDRLEQLEDRLETLLEDDNAESQQGSETEQATRQPRFDFTY